MFVKICGTTSEDDALLAVALGADAIGFVFAPSPRQIAPQQVADIVKRLPPEIITVGVFRNEAPARVVAVVQAAGLRGAQLHGHENPTETRWVRERVPMVIKAFPAGDARVGSAGGYGADAILLDAPSPGSGELFDWAFAGEMPPGQRLVIAGGLDPDNVAAAIERTHPWGVDVVSGVEREPGRKDPVKLRTFIVAARAAAPEPYDPDEESPYDWQEE
ncbi:MAG: phosphoribosylanthranilate isomerase [Acidimicrobiales bacterium]